MKNSSRTPSRIRRRPLTKRKTKPCKPKPVSEFAPWCDCIRQETRAGVPVYMGRDLGQVLGFGSNGGNLTRNFGTVWKHMFERGVDFFQNSSRDPIWLTEIAVVRALELVHEGNNPERAANARALLSREHFGGYDGDESTTRRNVMNNGIDNDVKRAEARMHEESAKTDRSATSLKRKKKKKKKNPKAVLTALVKKALAEISQRDRGADRGGAGGKVDQPAADAAAPPPNKFKQAIERMKARRRLANG